MLKSNDIHSIQLNTIIESTGETNKNIVGHKEIIATTPIILSKKK